MKQKKDITFKETRSTACHPVNLIGVPQYLHLQFNQLLKEDPIVGLWC